MEDLMQKVAEALQESFVGNYIFSAKDLTRIYDFTGAMLRRFNYERGGFIPDKYDGLFFVSMVNAIKTWDANEDTFFECIYRKLLGSSGSQKIYRYLTEVIDRLGQKGKIFYLSGCTKKYYATVLAHAFAPISSTNSFFDLCWELYSQDMNFTYLKGDDIFSLITEELKRSFNNEESLEKDIKLGSGIYSLRAGIKRLAIDIPPKMIAFIDWTISLIDRMFSGEILKNTSYFQEIIQKWWTEKEKNFGRAKPRRNPSVRALTDYSAIRPRYSFEKDYACIIIPSIRLKSNVTIAPILNIYCGGELFDQHNLNTYGTGLTMATKEFILYADNLVSECGSIRCVLEIIHCGEVIYQSNQTLFRDYLLFNKNGREVIQEECFPGNYTLFAPQFDFSLYPNNIKRKDRNLYVFNALDGEVLQNKNKCVFFVSETQNRNMRFIADVKKKVKYIYNGEEYAVIDGELKIAVNSDIDVSKYGVRYEETDFRLKDFSCVQNDNDGSRMFLITELLNACEPQKINVFQYANNKIESSFNVVKFQNISITYDKPFYFDTFQDGTVRFLTEKYDKTVVFNAEQGDIYIHFEDGEMVLSPPLLRWKIDDRDFSTQYEKCLWYEDFSNAAVLHIDIPPELSYQVFTNISTYLVEEADMNSFKFGELLYSLYDKTESLTIFIKIKNLNILCPILGICFKEEFRTVPFEIVKNELIWNPKPAFIGNKNSRFLISFLKNDSVVYKFEAETNAERYLLNSIDIGYYHVRVDLIKHMAFREVYHKIYESDITYGDVNQIRFKDKYLKISQAMLSDRADYEQIKTFYIDHLCYKGVDNGYCYYIGEAYIVTPDGRKVYLNSMKNDEGSYDRTNPLRLELRSETSCFLVAGVNPRDMNDFLGEFTLDKRRCISNINDRRHARGIDYYVFDKREVQM